MTKKIFCIFLICAIMFNSMSLLAGPVSGDRIYLGTTELYMRYYSFEDYILEHRGLERFLYRFETVERNHSMSMFNSPESNRQLLYLTPSIQTRLMNKEIYFTGLGFVNPNSITNEQIRRHRAHSHINQRDVFVEYNGVRFFIEMNALDIINMGNVTLQTNLAFVNEYYILCYYRRHSAHQVRFWYGENLIEDPSNVLLQIPRHRQFTERYGSIANFRIFYDRTINCLILHPSRNIIPYCTIYWNISNNNVVLSIYELDIATQNLTDRTRRYLKRRLFEIEDSPRVIFWSCIEERGVNRYLQHNVISMYSLEIHNINGILFNVFGSAGINRLLFLNLLEAEYSQSLYISLINNSLVSFGVTSSDFIGPLGLRVGMNAQQVAYLFGDNPMEKARMCLSSGNPCITWIYYPIGNTRLQIKFDYETGLVKEFQLIRYETIEIREWDSGFVFYELIDYIYPYGLTNVRDTKAIENRRPHLGFSRNRILANVITNLSL